MFVTRTQWLDQYVDGADSAVFVDGQVIVLSELATTIVDLVAEGAAVDDVAHGLAAAFGEPEGQDLLTQTTSRVHELIDAGVLVERAPEQTDG